MTKYVRNEGGAVHSVTDEHFEEVLHEVSESGNRYLKHGWSEISEAQAKKANPQLFGAPDPDVTAAMTTDEIVKAQERVEARDKYLGKTPENPPVDPVDPPADPPKA